MESFTGPWYIYRNFSEQLSGNGLAVMRGGAMKTLVRGEEYVFSKGYLFSC